MDHIQEPIKQRRLRQAQPDLIDRVANIGQSLQPEQAGFQATALHELQRPKRVKNDQCANRILTSVLRPCNQTCIRPLRILILLWIDKSNFARLQDQENENI